jgi:PAS domain S-box-containing protein
MHDPDRQALAEGSIDETFGDQSTAFFEKIVSIAPSILYVFDLIEMRNIWVNRSMFLWLGYSPEEIAELGSDMLQILMHPDDMARYPDHFRCLRKLVPDEVARFEYRMKGKDGEWHWLVSEEMAFSFAPDGSVTQIIGSAHDVSDARNREDKINLLVREMHHRIKNLFTVVLSMISLTSKTKMNASTEDAFKTVAGRVNALAVSQSLSMPTAEESPASFRELIGLILKPYVATHDIQVSGGDPSIVADQARLLAMVLHELATNAIKYGSLSIESGQLFVDVQVLDHIDGTKEAILLWTERSDSELSDLEPDQSKGFGTKLIRRSIEQAHGTIQLDWRKEGLQATLRFPLGEI